MGFKYYFCVKLNCSGSSMKKWTLIWFTGFQLVFAQEKDLCMIRYNEFDENGQEHFITSIAWLNEMPEIPDYIYFDKDLGKKVVIKTKITPYKGQAVASFKNFQVKPGEYAKIMLICPDSREIKLLNLEKLLPDNAGQSLAFEVKTNDKQLIIYCYPFEMDFPFKFEEDIVNKTFTIEQLEKYCSN